jgi:hypothetical protein
MPVHNVPSPSNAPAQLGEEDIDFVQERALALGDFARRVHVALEYSLQHQRFNEDECRHRRGLTDEWLATFREGNNWERWRDRVLRPTLNPKEQAEQKAADQRAELLLRSTLSKKQLKELDRRDYFHVTVGGRRFRITRGRSHNIKEVDPRGRILRSLCAHPIELVPTADTMLSQKLLLESKPEEFFKIANVQRHRGPLRPRIPVTDPETPLVEAALDATAATLPEINEPASGVNERAA